MEFRNYFHAPATMLLRGKDVTLQLLLPDDVSDLPCIELSYTVSGKKEHGGRMRMLPTDGYRAEQSYTVFAVTIPSGDLQGDTLQYRFLKGDAESACYTVTLADPAVLPPLIITETSLWPCVHPYIEIQNLTKHFGIYRIFQYTLKQVCLRGVFFAENLNYAVK